MAKTSPKTWRIDSILGIAISVLTVALLVLLVSSFWGYVLAGSILCIFLAVFLNKEWLKNPITKWRIVWITGAVISTIITVPIALIALVFFPWSPIVGLSGLLSITFFTRMIILGRSAMNKIKSKSSIDQKSQSLLRKLSIVQLLLFVLVVVFFATSDIAFLFFFAVVFGGPTLFSGDLGNAIVVDALVCAFIIFALSSLSFKYSTQLIDRSSAPKQGRSTNKSKSFNDRL